MVMSCGQRVRNTRNGKLRFWDGNSNENEICLVVGLLWLYSLNRFVWKWIIECQTVVLPEGGATWFWDDDSSDEYFFPRTISAGFTKINIQVFCFVSEIYTQRINNFNFVVICVQGENSHTHSVLTCLNCTEIHDLLHGAMQHSVKLYDWAIIRCLIFYDVLYYARNSR